MTHTPDTTQGTRTYAPDDFAYGVEWGGNRCRKRGTRRLWQ